MRLGGSGRAGWVAAALICGLLGIAPLAQSPTPDGACRADLLARAALSQVGVTTHYDGSYQELAYPAGDIPVERGACTDVIIRAFRALDCDLQVAVHEDMLRSFDEYPQRWGLTRPDPNIDHRRVLNLMRFFSRQGASLPTTTRPADYPPGDVVAWQLRPGLFHIGIVVPAPEAHASRPLIVHNIGAGVQLEDVLFSFEIIGHYRYFRDPR